MELKLKRDYRARNRLEAIYRKRCSNFITQYIRRNIASVHKLIIPNEIIEIIIRYYPIFLSCNVWVIGLNNFGEFGEGNNTRTNKLISYFEEKEIQIDDISSGYFYNIALDRNGNVYTWGFNKFGQCGHGHTDKSVSTPAIVKTLLDEVIVDIECGAGYLCALTINGDCYIWGKNNFYQCCNSNNQDIILKPLKINQYLPENKIIKQISLGYNSTIMILADKQRQLYNI